MKRMLNSMVLFVFLVGLSACGQSMEAQWQEQYDLGVRYLSEGNYEEAIIAFTAAIEIDPKRAEGYIGRGNTYILSGETEDNLTAAHSDYETALELDVALADAWLGLADVYIRQGDYDRAIEILYDALEKVGNKETISDKIKDIEENWDSRDWALEDPITMEELTIGGKPFYQVDIYEAQAAYPPGQFDEIVQHSDVLLYSPPYQVDENASHTGSFILEQYVESGQLLNVTYTAKDDSPTAQYQPEFRGIVMAEDFNSVLKKLGFTQRGIDYILTSVEAGKDGVLGNYSTIKQWEDHGETSVYFEDKLPAVRWGIFDEKYFYIDLSWWSESASINLQLSFRDERLDVLWMGNSTS